MPGVMPLAASAVATAAPTGSRRRSPWRWPCDASGVMPRPFIGEELARCGPTPVWISAEDQKDALRLLAKACAQGAQEIRGNGRTAALRHGRGSITSGAVWGLAILFRAARSPSGTWSKPRYLRAEALGDTSHPSPARRWRARGAATKGAFKTDDLEAFGMAVHEVVAARHLEGEFDRFGAGVGEENRGRQKNAPLVSARAFPAPAPGRGWRWARAFRPVRSAPPLIWDWHSQRR